MEQTSGKMSKICTFKVLKLIVCVCKKWHCRFFEASDLPQDESVRVWAFLACKKIEIRVMWTFTASKKENPCSFLRVRSSAKKIALDSKAFLHMFSSRYLHWETLNSFSFALEKKIKCMFWDVVTCKKLKSYVYVLLARKKLNSHFWAFESLQ